MGHAKWRRLAMVLHLPKRDAVLALNTKSTVWALLQATISCGKARMNVVSVNSVSIVHSSVHIRKPRTLFNAILVISDMQRKERKKGLGLTELMQKSLQE